MIQGFLSTKRALLTSLLTLTFLGVGALVTSAAPTPNSIAYQGFLTSATGTAQTGTTTVTVRLYDASTGGTLLFEELHPTTPIVNGYFSVQIGSVGDVNGSTAATGITDLLFDKSYYLTVELGSPFSTGEMTTTGGTRSQLGTVPFANIAYGALQATSSTGLTQQKGKMYFNTGDNQLYIYNGTAWNPLSVLSTTFSTLTVTGTTSLQAASTTALSVSGPTFLNALTLTSASSTGGITATSFYGALLGTATLTSLTVTGNTTLANASSTNLTSSGQAYLNNASATALTATNLVTTNSTSTNSFITSLLATLANITDLVVGNSTTTNAVITNATIANATATGNVTTNTLTATGQATLSTASATALTATALYSVNSVLTNATATLFAAVNASTTFATTSRSYITTLIAASSTLTDALLTRSTTTDAYITRLVVASSTLTEAIVTTLNAVTLNVSGQTTLSNASATALSVSGPTFLNALTLTSASSTGGITATTFYGALLGTANLTSLLVSGQTTLSNASATNLTVTNNLVTNNLQSVAGTSTNFFATLFNAVTSTVSNLFFTSATGTDLVISNTLATNNFSATSGTSSLFTTLSTTTLALDGGNVGIGTTTPGSQLSVSGSDATVTIDNNNGSASFLRMNNYGTGRFVIDARSTAVALSALNSTPLAFQTSAAERMRIDTNGNIGIGSTTPAFTLTVNGITKIYSGTAGVDFGGAAMRFTGGTGTIYTGGYSQPITVDGSSISLNGLSGNYVGIGTTTPAGLLNIVSSTSGAYVTTQNSSNAFLDVGVSGASTAAIDSNADFAWRNKTYANRGGNTFTSELMRLTTAGNLGIGTTTPTVRLSVSGNTFLGGNLTATGTLSVSGQSTLSTASATALTVSDQTTLGLASTTALSATTLYGALIGSTGTFSSTLNVAGNTTLSNASATNLSISNNLVTSNLLSVLGTSTLATTTASSLTTTGLTFGNASSTGGLTLASLFGANLAACNTSTEKLLWANGTFTCGTDAGGAGGTITSLNGSSVASQTLATSTLPGVGLDLLITSSTTNGVHTFSLSPQAGYSIPLTASSSNWNNFFNTPVSYLTAGANILFTSTSTIALNPNVSVTSITSTNASTTNFTSSGQAYLNNASTTNVSVSNNLTSNNLTSVSATSSTFFATLLNAVTAIVTNLTATNATATNLATLGTTTLATTGGSVGIGTTTPTALLSVASSVANGTSQLLTVGTSSDIFTVLANGRVGIGTLSPNSPLHVAGNIQTSANFTGPAAYLSNIYEQNSSLNAGINLVNTKTINFSTDNIVRMTLTSSGFFGLGTSSPSSFFSIASTTASGISRLFSIGTSSEVLTVLANGNLGLGTASPSAQLHIANNTTGTVRLDGSTVQFELQAQSNVRASIGTLTSHPFRFVTSNAERMTITSVGDIGIGTTTPNSLLSISSSTANGSSMLLSVSTSTSIFSVLADGKVGIGTTSPQFDLTIEGTGPVDILLRDNAQSADLKGYMVRNQSASLNFGRVNDSGSTLISYLTLFSGGNVGIGSTTPGYKLSVTGDGYFGGNLTATGTISVSSTGTSTLGGNGYGPDGISLGNGDRVFSSDNFGIYDTSVGLTRFGYSTNNTYDVRSTGEHRFNINGGQVMVIDTNGRFGVNDSTPDFRAEISASSGSGYFGITNSTDGDILSVSSLGNLGIGSSSPGYKLSVIGDGYFGGNLTATGTLSVSGQTTLTNATASALTVTGLSVFNTSSTTVGTINSLFATNASTTNQTTSNLFTANLNLTGSLRDSTNASGTLGQLLWSTGTSTLWVSTSSLGVSSSLSGGVFGYATRWLTSSTLGTSTLLDNGAVLGINATSSSYTFNVQGSSGVNPLNIASSTGSSLFTVAANGRVGIGSSTPISTLSLTGAAGTNPLMIASSVGATLLTVLQNGNVGVGIDAPASRLDVTNSATTSPIVTLRDAVGNVSMEIRAGTSTYLNTFIGRDAGLSNTGGFDNSFVGTFAGVSNTVGGNNVFIGAHSGYSNTTGNYNSFIGKRAATSNITGTYNTVLGGNAAYYNTGGSRNAFIGFASGQNISTSTNNTIIGFEAGYGPLSTASSSNNTLIGYQSGYNMATTTGNLFLGYQSGYNTTLGDYNILLGYNNDVASTTGSRQLNIGNLLFGTNLGINNTTATGGISIGTSTPSAKFSIQGSNGYSSALFDVATTTSSSFATASLFRVMPNGRVGIGSSTPVASLAVTGTARTNPLMIASSTGATLFTILQNGNVGIGSSSPSYALDINGSANLAANQVYRIDGVAVVRASSTRDNYFFGGSSGSQASASGNLNSALGGYALSSLTLGSYNTAVGGQSLYYTTTGTGNSAFGMSSGLRNIDGDGNTFLGSYTASQGSFGAMSYNTLVGHSAGAYLATSTGNVLVGYQAGYSITTGSQNLILGYNVDAASTTGSYQLNIGNILFGQSIDGTGTNVSSGNIGIGTSTPSAKFSIQAASGYTGALFDIASTTSSVGATTSLFTVLPNGRVGIGSSTPSRTLTVSGSLGLSGGFFDSTSASGTLGQLLWSTGTSTLWVSTSSLGITGGSAVTGGANGFLARFTSATTLATSTLLDDGTVLGINATSSADTLRIRTLGGLNALNVASSSGSSLFKITSVGTVGINTTSPSSLLDITGTSTEASQGSEMITATNNRDFSSANNWTYNTGWTRSTSGYASTTSTGVGTLTLPSANLSNAPVAGATYQITFLVYSHTTDSLSVAFGGTTHPVNFGTVRQSNQTHTIIITAVDGSDITFTPGTSWLGRIDNVSIRRITTTNAIQTLRNDDGTEGLEFRSGGSGYYNSFIGYRSGMANFSGTYNSAFGYQSGYSNTTGIGNSFSGSLSGYSNTTGGYNTFSGFGSGYSNTTGTENTFYGYNSGWQTTTGGYNTFIGSQVGINNRTGSYNTILGHYAGVDNISGGNNIAIGVSALALATSTSYNLAIGVSAMYNSTRGSNNIAIGESSLASIGGTNNIGIGGYALGNSTSTGTNYNIALGDNAMADSYDGKNNIALGNESLRNTRGTGNLSLGAYALYNSTSGSYNIAFGADVGGSSAALYQNTTGSYNIALGYASLVTATSSSDNIALGRYAMNTLYGNTNIAIGNSALGGAGYSAANIAIGASSLYYNDGGVDNTAVGNNALGSVVGGDRNTAVGSGALLSSTGDDNTAVGQNTLTTISAGSANSAFGRNAGLSMVSGSWNSIFGYGALNQIQNATETVAFGSYAGWGGGAGVSTVGSVFVGANSGYLIQSGSDYNTLVGFNSGYNISSGRSNILIGQATTSANANITTGSFNIVIGNNISAPSATDSYQLNIGNLLYGTNINGVGSTLSTGNIGIGTTTPIAKFAIQGTGSTNPFTVASSSGSSLFTVLANGNIGVGTSTPDSPFDFVSNNSRITFEQGQLVGSAALSAYVPTITLSSSLKSGVASAWQGYTKFTYNAAGFLLQHDGYPTGSAPTGPQGLGFTTGGRVVADLFINSTGTVAIGTTTDVSSSLFIQGTSTLNPFTVASSTGTSLFTILANGNVGIASSTPFASLSITGRAGSSPFAVSSSSGSLFALITQTGAFVLASSTYTGSSGELFADFITTSSTTATSTIAGNLSVGNGGIFYNASTSVTSISSLELGNLSFDTNAGIVSWTDLPVTSAAATGTVQSYSAQIGGQSIFTVYAESDGIGGIQRPRVGVGSSSPVSTFSVTGTAGDNPFTVASSSGASLFTILANGNVGVGTSSPSHTFTVSSAGDTTSLIASAGIPSLNFQNGFSGNGIFSLSNDNSLRIGVSAATNTSQLVVASSADVGIGTEFPTALIRGAGSPSYQGLAILKNFPTLVLQSTNGGTYTTSFINSYGDTQISNHYTSGNMIFSNAGSETFRIVSNGSIGIGTTSPTASLALVSRGGVNPLTVASSSGASMLTINQLGSLLVATSSAAFDNSKLVVQGTTTLIGTATSPTALRVIGNIDNTADSMFKPKLLSFADVGGQPYSFTVSGKFAYTANFAGADFSVVDISNPKQLVTVATLSLGGSPIDVAVSGHYAYVSNFSNASVSVIDIANPLDPLLVSTTSVGGSPRNIFNAGKYIYVVNQSGAYVSVLDISNPTKPVLVSNFSTASTPLDVYVSGKYAYVIDSGGLHIFDVSNPVSVSSVAVLAAGSGSMHMAVSGNYAYITNQGSSDLSIISISNPTSPTTTATLAVGSGPNGVYVSGRYAYVTDYIGNNLYTIDVSDPSSPIILSSTSIANDNESVEVVGRYLYTASINAGRLYAYDLGGLESTSAIIHSLEAGNLSVRNDIQTAGMLSVGTALTVGQGGFMSQGNSSIYGSLQVGTSTYPNFLVNSANNTTNIGTSTGLASLFIQGTSTLNPFTVASSSGASLFTILADGNVGIGTTTSSGGLLEVYKNQDAGTYSNITNPNSGNAAYAGIYVNSDIAFAGVQVRSSTKTGPCLGGISCGNLTTFDAYGGPLGLVTLTSNPVYLATNNAIRMTVDTVGNVGVGTSSPLSKLHVYGGDIFGQSAVGSANIILGNANGSSNNKYSYISGASNVTAFGKMNDDLITKTEFMRIDGSGNIGIGTSSPGLISGSSNRVLSIESSNNPSLALYNSTANKQWSLTNLSNGDLIMYDASRGTSPFQIASSGMVGVGSFASSATLEVTSLPGVTPFAVASSSGSMLLTLTQSGNLALGTSTASSRLDIYQSTSSTSTDMFRILSDVGSTENPVFKIKANGDIFTDGNTTIGTPADLAENYPTLDDSITHGMVVSLSTTTVTWSQSLPSGSTTDYEIATVQKAKVGEVALGIISTRPGILLGGNTDKGIPVAFSGRVPVYVVGEVKKGDSLTVSTSTPGYAMRLTENGQSIGRALSSSPADATSSLIMMIVENKEKSFTVAGVDGLSLISSSSTSSITVRDSLTQRLSQGLSVVREYVAVTVRGVRGYFDELYATMIHTDTLCVGSTCVTESQLQQMLQQSNVVPSPSPVPPSDSGGVVAGTSTDEGTNSGGTTTDQGSSGNGTTTDNGSVSSQGDTGSTTGGGDPFLDPGSAPGDGGSTETSPTS